MKFILARKLQMTRVFGEDGSAKAGTILSAAPITVTQVKTAAGSDKYDAVQVGEGARRAKNISKAVLGHTKGLPAGRQGKGFAALREFRGATAELGSEITVDQFAVGDVVEISGTTKGKGFAGVVKRHGFHGGRRTHGQKHSEREPGSIGGSGGRAGGRVAKGIRMAGRMGAERVTVKNLKVLAVDPAENLLIVSGAVPGNRGALLEIVSMPTGRQAQ